MTISKWNTKALKEEVVKNLLSNGEIVGNFLESDAKRRITQVQEPDWGAKYRKYVALLIRSEVERVGNGVEIRIGIPPGKTTKAGETSRHIGFYIETGSAKAPAHPYLRPAVFMNASKIVALLEGK